MEIGTIYIPSILLLIMLVLVVLFILCYRRQVTHDGKWTLSSETRHAWTDKVTGTSFASKHRSLGLNELGSRRKKFGKPVWLWPITVTVIALLLLALRGMGVI